MFNCHPLIVRLLAPGPASLTPSRPPSPARLPPSAPAPPPPRPPSPGGILRASGGLGRAGPGPGAAAESGPGAGGQRKKGA